MPIRLVLYHHYTSRSLHSMHARFSDISGSSALSTGTHSRANTSDHRWLLSTTFQHVKWDVIALRVCKVQQVDGFHWDKPTFDGSSLVRQLCLGDLGNTLLDVRVPLLTANRTEAMDTTISRRLASEVATMKYIEKFTNIPIQHVWIYDFDFANKAGSPYIVLDRVEGVPLSSVWNVMQTRHREAILVQMAAIFLELWNHRFDRPGALLDRLGSPRQGKDGLQIVPEASIITASDIPTRYNILSTSYTSAGAYWIDYANAFLSDLENTHFGDPDHAFAYAQGWIIRSFIPALFSTALDRHGFPLFHANLLAHNIILTDLDTTPQIAAVIGWEGCGPTFSSAFAHYPAFLLDPTDDFLLQQRNSKDKTFFLQAISERESASPLVFKNGPSLAHLIDESHGVHLFQQIMRYPDIYDHVYPQLFAFVLGRAASENEDSELETDLLWSLMEKGSLRRKTVQFSREVEALQEARMILDGSEISPCPTASEFRAAVERNMDCFDPNGAVMVWLGGEG